MIAPYGLTILDNCVSCPVKKMRPFCNLPLPAAQRLHGIKSTATAELMEPGQANFIPREPLIIMMRDFPEVALHVAEQLSRNYFAAYEEIRTLGLTASPSEKLAKLLLQWSIKGTQYNGSSRIKLTLTQGEIAEVIGTTRETVARLFADFKRKHLLQVQGATLVIHSRFELEQLVQS